MLFRSLANIRKLEIRKITLLMAIRNAILAVSVMMPILASMLTFITYYLSNHALNAAPVFSSLALFNALSVPLELLPVAVGRVVDANASVKRISEFLDAEEVQDEATWDFENKSAITVDHGAFTWEQNTSQHAERNAEGPPKVDKQTKDAKKATKERSKELKPQSKILGQEGLSTKPTIPPSHNLINQDEKPPFQIDDINLSIGRNELIGVIGSVGSGKSSLLSALAGDMRKTNGNITFGDRKSVV